MGKNKMVSIRSGLEHFPCKIREKNNWESYDTYRRKKKSLRNGHLNIKIRNREVVEV